MNLDRTENHLNLAGKLFIVLGAIAIPLAIISFNTLSIINYNEFFESLHDFSIGFIHFHQPLRVLFILPTIYLLVSILFLTTGFGLVYEKKWARKLALIPAFLLLFKFPVGTAIGIYIIYLVQRKPIIAQELKREANS